MTKIYEVKIQHDYETSERAGAGGMFQVISCTGVLEDGEEISLNVNCGIHFYDNSDVKDYLKQNCPQYDFSNATLEDDD